MDIDRHTSLIYDFDLRFPPLSRTVAEVSELLAANGMPDTDRLIHIVHMDPLVVASVLRRINSAFYGMRRQFQDIRKAILMIGFIEVSNIVLTSGYVGLKKVTTSVRQLDVIDRIMRVSIGSGFYANLIAQHLKLPDKSSAFTGGLLHSIGRLVLLYNLPDEYTRLCEDGDRYLPTAAQEAEAFGVDHSSIGSLAAQHWSFPELITSLIELYPNPGHLITPDHRTLALALSAAIELSEDLCKQFAAERTKLSEDTSDEQTSIMDQLPLPFDLKIPGSIGHLANDRDLPVDQLSELINQKQKEAISYIELMVKA